MDIIVTVKQVPDPDTPPSHFRVDEAARRVVPPAGVAPVMNGYDANALEEALRLREQHGGTVRAEGDLDLRGTLGVSKEAPVGFQQIRLKFDLDTDASAEQLADLQRLTERYCVVYQTLRQPPAIEVALRGERSSG